MEVLKSCRKVRLARPRALSFSGLEQNMETVHALWFVSSSPVVAGESEIVEAEIGSAALASTKEEG